MRIFHIWDDIKSVIWNYFIYKWKIILTFKSLWRGKIFNSKEMFGVEYRQISKLQVLHKACFLFSSVIQSLLVDAVEDAIDSYWVISWLFLVFIWQFLLRTSICEVWVVRNSSEVESIMPQELIKLIGFGLWPLSGGGFVTSQHMIRLFLFSLWEFGKLFDNSL